MLLETVSARTISFGFELWICQGTLVLSPENVIRMIIINERGVTVNTITSLLLFINDYS